MKLIINPEMEAKETNLKLKKNLKLNMFGHVVDAFPNSIVTWWITDKCETQIERKEFLFCTKERTIQDITGLDKKALWLLESCHTFTFKLKQNVSILDDYIDCYQKLDRDSEEAVELFWSHGVDDIFCDYQRDFEDALDLALEKPLEDFIQKAFVLIDPISQ